MRNRHFKFYLESSNKGPGLVSTVFVLDSSGELHLGPEMFSRKNSYLLDWDNERKWNGHFSLNENQANLFLNSSPD